MKTLTYKIPEGYKIESINDPEGFIIFEKIKKEIKPGKNKESFKLGLNKGWIADAYEEYKTAPFYIRSSNKDLSSLIMNLSAEIAETTNTSLEGSGRYLRLRNIRELERHNRLVILNNDGTLATKGKLISYEKVSDLNNNDFTIIIEDLTTNNLMFFENLFKNYRVYTLRNQYKDERNHVNHTNWI